MSQPSTEAKQENLTPPPTPLTYALILLGNVVPLLGVFIFGWSISEIIILYWLENLIIGFWNVPRILMARGGGKATSSNVFLAVFFTVHYGIFCLVHGIFIMAMILFAKDGGDSFLDGSLSLSSIPFFTKTMLIGVATMFITIGIGFYQDYIATKQYLVWKPERAMAYPYGHIIAIHLAIMAAFFITLLLGSPMILLILLVVGKTLLELRNRSVKNKGNYFTKAVSKR